VVSSGSPCSTAAARTKGLNVEPGCMPLDPPIARFTLLLPGSPVSP
jgi:hypothetical protein